MNVRGIAGLVSVVFLCACAHGGAPSFVNGQQYLAWNKQRSAVVETASGLQYEIIREGAPGAPPPGASDIANVHYEGALIDGVVFDSSYKRGQPNHLPVNKLIPGWTEALQLMRPNAVYKVVLPSELGYGELGAEPVIPKNAVLVFTIELLGYQNGRR